MGSILMAATSAATGDTIFQQYVVGFLLVLLVVAFVKEWFPVEITALAGVAILLFTGVMDTKSILKSFANSGPLTVVCMFILSAALEQTGVITDLSRGFNKLSKGNEFYALVTITLGAFIVSPFVNNTPVVVILMPVVLAFCRENNLSPSRLLIPLSFATILGGTCSVVGTSTNLVVLGQVQSQGYDAIRMFTMAPMGLLYGAVGLLYLWTVGRKILPKRETLATLLPQGVQRDFLLQVLITPNSHHIGNSPFDLMQSDLKGTRIVEIRRKGVTLQDDLMQITLQAGDRILTICSTLKVKSLQDAPSTAFALGWDEDSGLESMEKRDAVIVEAMIGYDSEFAGRSIAEIKLRQRFKVLVLAVHRRGKNITNLMTSTSLEEGDTLLIQGPKDDVDHLITSRRILPLSQAPIENFRRHKRGYAIAAMGAFILFGLLGSFGNAGSFFAFFEQFDSFFLAFVGALIVVLTGCLAPKAAYKSVDWGIIFLILAMLCIGDSMSKTGLAKAIAQSVVHLVDSPNPIYLIAALYLLCSILTELISNNAVAAVIGPLAYQMALEADANPLPFILAVMFGASASFSTPIGYQTNTYVYNAGGYRFTDFIKIGLPLNIMLWIVFILSVGLLYPLK